jgi:hypothetical protein
MVLLYVGPSFGVGAHSASRHFYPYIFWGIYRPCGPKKKEISEKRERKKKVRWWGRCYLSRQILTLLFGGAKVWNIEILPVDKVQYLYNARRLPACGQCLRVVLTTVDNAANSVRSPYLRGIQPLILHKYYISTYRNSLPSFCPISVNYMLRKYQPIPNQNTNSRCNSRISKLHPRVNVLQLVLILREVYKLCTGFL